METHGQACVDLAHVGRPDANLGPADLVPVALLPLPGRVNPAGLGLEEQLVEAVCARAVCTFDSVPLSTHFLASGPCPSPALPGFWSPHGGPCLSPATARHLPVRPLSLFIFHPHQTPFCPFLILPQLSSSVPLFK